MLSISWHLKTFFDKNDPCGGWVLWILKKKFMYKWLRTRTPVFLCEVSFQLYVLFILLRTLLLPSLSRYATTPFNAVFNFIAGMDDDSSTLLYTLLLMSCNSINKDICVACKRYNCNCLCLHKIFKSCVRRLNDVGFILFTYRITLYLSCVVYGWLKFTLHCVYLYSYWITLYGERNRWNEEEKLSSCKEMINFRVF